MVKKNLNYKKQNIIFFFFLTSSDGTLRAYPYIPHWWPEVIEHPT